MANRKKTNNDLQNTTHKTNDRAKRTPLKTMNKKIYEDYDQILQNILRIIYHSM